MTEDNKASKPIIGYWKIRGLVAGINYQLAYSKVDYDQEQYEQGDAPDFSCAPWTDVKFNLNLTFPNLPYLKDGDFTLTETSAIHRYCAKKWCPELLCLDDDEMYGKAEMAWGIFNDIKQFVTGPCYGGNGDKAALWEMTCPRLETVAKLLGGQKFLAGEKVCCADFQFAELVDMIDFISGGDIYKVYPVMKEYKERVFGLPGVKECYEECSKLTFNNKCGKINN